MDLRFLDPLPGRTVLARRWGWSAWKVRQVLADQRTSRPPPDRLQVAPSDSAHLEPETSRSPPGRRQDPPSGTAPGGDLEESTAKSPESLDPTWRDDRGRPPRAAPPGRRQVGSNDSGHLGPDSSRSPPETAPPPRSAPLLLGGGGKDPDQDQDLSPTPSSSQGGSGGPAPPELPPTSPAGARFIRLITRWSTEPKPAERWRVSPAEDLAWFVREIEAKYDDVDLVEQLERWDNWLEDLYRSVQARSRGKRWIRSFKNPLRNWIGKARRYQNRPQRGTTTHAHTPPQRARRGAYRGRSLGALPIIREPSSDD